MSTKMDSLGDAVRELGSIASGVASEVASLGRTAFEELCVPDRKTTDERIADAVEKLARKK